MVAVCEEGKLCYLSGLLLSVLMLCVSLGDQRVRASQVLMTAAAGVTTSHSDFGRRILN